MDVNPETVTGLMVRGAIALALGLIIGFQREQSEKTIAGIRTFPLFALVGFFCGLSGLSFGGWLVAAGLIALAILFGVGTFKELREGKLHMGLTTEAAALLTFLIGAYLAVGKHVEIAIAAGGIAAVLLYLKEPMHGWVANLKRNEARAIMQFVLIAFVLFPLLPDQAYDSYGVLNPQEIWKMVTLITGISLISYNVQKLLGAQTGAFWSGLLGGLVSSTATTATFSRRSRANAKGAQNKLVILAIILASTSALIRVFVEILFVTPTTFTSLMPPLLLLFLLLCVLSFFAFQRARGDTTVQDISVGDPSQLKAALVFGALYAGILYASAWARDQFGAQGLYYLAILSGFIDVDAITISTAQQIESKAIDTGLGWRLITIAFLSNLLFKSGIAAVLGAGSVRWQVPAYFIAAISGGIALLSFWP